MNEHQSLELPLDYWGLKTYTIREDGTVRTPKGTLLTPLTMAHAAREIASKDPFGLGNPQGQPPTLIGTTDGRLVATTTVITAEARDFPAAMKKWKKAIPRQDRGSEKNFTQKPRVVEFIPDDETLSGDPEQGWARIELRTGTVWFFHGPSTAARLFQAAPGFHE